MILGGLGSIYIHSIYLQNWQYIHKTNLAPKKIGHAARNSGAMSVSGRATCEYTT